MTLNIKKEISAVKSVGGKFITTKSNKLSSTDIFKEYFEAHNVNEKKFLTKVRKNIILKVFKKYLINYPNSIV